LAIDIKALANPTPLQELDFVKHKTALLKRINRFWRLQHTYMPELVHFMTPGQREIWNNKTRSPEAVKLFMPSELRATSRTKTCEKGLDKLEEKMREGEMMVTLEELRQALQLRTVTNHFRHHNMMG
jgi:hypothetical protein